MRRGSWSAPELMRLRELFPRTRPERLARLLDRSTSSVLRCARRLFARERRIGPWSAEEDRRIRQSIGVHDLDTMALIVARAPEDVAERLYELRASLRSGPWEPGEVAALKRLHGSRRTADLALCLGRAPDDVEAKAAELRLEKDKGAGVGGPVRMPRWTSAEVARLRDLYATKDNLEIARILGRSVSSVANKASQLGLGKGRAALRRMGQRNRDRRRG